MTELKETPINPKAIDAVAESWASIDGKITSYEIEERSQNMGYNDPRYTGHYEGYQAEARELIERIRRRGFDVAPLPADLDSFAREVMR